MAYMLEKKQTFFEAKESIMRLSPLTTLKHLGLEYSNHQDWRTRWPMSTDWVLKACGLSSVGEKLWVV